MSLIQHVPVKGSDKVLELHSHSGKHSRGTLTVNLDIVGKREEVCVYEREREKEKEKDLSRLHFLASQ